MFSEDVVGPLAAEGDDASEGIRGRQVSPDGRTRARRVGADRSQVRQPRMVYRVAYLPAAEYAAAWGLDPRSEAPGIAADGERLVSIATEPGQRFSHPCNSTTAGPRPTRSYANRNPSTGRVRFIPRSIYARPDASPGSG